MLDYDEDVVRKYVRELRMFYKDVLVSGIVSLISIVAWCATGGGFWPIWVFIALSVHLLLRAVAIGRVSPADIGLWCRCVSFLRPEWEEQQYQKIIAGKGAHKRNDEAFREPGAIDSRNKSKSGKTLNKEPDGE
jgi:hypothetical protein